MAAKSTITLYANPYSGGAGFYFSDLEEFEAGMEKLLKRGIEEVELEPIDGEDWALALAKAADPTQASIADFFELITTVEISDDEESAAAAAFYALEHERVDIKDLLSRRDLERVRDDKGIRCGMSTEEYAEELLAEGVISDEAYETYFDWDKFGGDIRSDVEEAAVESARDNADSEEDADAEEERVRAEYDRMSDIEVAEEYVDSVGSLSDALPSYKSGRRGQRGPTLEDYFDLDKFARDLDLSGDVHEFEFAGQTCVATSPNG